MSNGDYTHWCLRMPAIQMALNCRVTQRHHSTPFSLMFTRPFNLFNDYTRSVSELLTEEEIMKRNEILTNLLYPSIRESTDSYNLRMIDDFALSKKILKQGFPLGAMVMKRVDISNGKLDPVYEGPFRVVKRTLHNTYVLLDSTGMLLPKNIPPSKMKLVSLPTNEEVGGQADDDAIDYEVERILDHRGAATRREYLIKWKDYPYSEKSWVPATQIMTPQCITSYWKKKTKR